MSMPAADFYLANDTASTPAYICPSSAGASPHGYNSINIAFERIDAAIDEANHTYVIWLDNADSSQTDSASGHETLTAADMIPKVLSVFGLNVSQLADILRISRASIYNHLAGKEPESNDSYLQLYKLALMAEEIRPTYDGGLKSVLVNGKTLLKHLKTGWQDSDTILKTCAAINEKLAQRPAHPARKESQTMATRRISKAG